MVIQLVNAMQRKTVQFIIQQFDNKTGNQNDKRVKPFLRMGVQSGVGDSWKLDVFGGVYPSTWGKPAACEILFRQ